VQAVAHDVEVVLEQADTLAAASIAIDKTPRASPRVALRDMRAA
jgi:hypothetical protein